MSPKETAESFHGHRGVPPKHTSCSPKAERAPGIVPRTEIQVVPSLSQSSRAKRPGAAPTTFLDRKSPPTIPSNAPRHRSILPFPIHTSAGAAWRSWTRAGLPTSTGERSKLGFLSTDPGGRADRERAHVHSLGSLVISGALRGQL